MPSLDEFCVKFAGESKKLLFVNSLSLLANSFTKLVSPSPKKTLYQVPSMEFTLWCRSPIEEVSKVYLFLFFFALISYVYMINLNLYSCRLCAIFGWKWLNGFIILGCMCNILGCMFNILWCIFKYLVNYIS